MVRVTGGMKVKADRDEVRSENQKGMCDLAKAKRLVSWLHCLMMLHGGSKIVSCNTVN